MWQMSRKSSLQYITSGHKTTTILVFFRKDWDAVLLVRLLGKRFHSWLPLYHRHFMGVNNRVKSHPTDDTRNLEKLRWYGLSNQTDRPSGSDRLENIIQTHFNLGLFIELVDIHRLAIRPNGDKLYIKYTDPTNKPFSLDCSRRTLYFRSGVLL